MVQDLKKYGRHVRHTACWRGCLVRTMYVTSLQLTQLRTHIVAHRSSQQIYAYAMVFMHRPQTKPQRMKVDKGRVDLLLLLPLHWYALQLAPSSLQRWLVNCSLSLRFDSPVYGCSYDLAPAAFFFLSKLRCQLTSSLSSLPVSCPMLVSLGNFAKREMCFL